jgi:hypothetical protein
MSVDRFAVTDFGILFHVDSVVHLDGRGGPILVGRVDGDGKLRVGDQLKFGTKGGDAVVLTVIGFDLTPAAAAGALSLVVTGEGSDRVAPGVSLRQIRDE